MTPGAAVVCGACGERSPAGKRFCAECGAALTAACPACGAAVEPGKRFCGDCGAALAGPTAGTTAGAGEPLASRPPVAERRVCSVLFGDLVGFTPMSEARDAEDVRELLSRYFALARTIVTRYGGTVEKFIGDAVMAVWGVPVAREDDAERAVRAGLDLVDAVAELGEQVGAPLEMRVGIVTDEVAVTLGATGEGMVAGDPVNTAARVQSAAAPGEVWVDGTTRSLTVAAVAYVDAGEHALKGKAEPVTLHAARRVVATVGGAQRMDGLEAPFVGRERDMRLVKELFHAALEEGRPRLVSVTGLPGVGKSRLGWEFFKYVDGISDRVRWHRGRCLAYGEGVAFWALSEMVRGRLDILEGDEPVVVAAKLDAGLARWVVDADERAWLRPALATLVGAPGGASGVARGELFAAWQLFFERLVDAEAVGAALLVEDLQWADEGLLDFLDQLVARSGAPIFVLTLARPEINDRRPGWGIGRRATALYLDPLPAAAMTEVVDGLVEGLSDDTRGALVTRAEGIPLYAVETVRALIDRDLVVPRGGRYVVAADSLDVAALAAPTSLHTLLASRLDGLPAAERLTVQNAAVLGLAFSRGGLARLNAATGAGEDVDRLLAALATKDILAQENDPRSPERGQYRFVQAMVRTVAYETLSRRDRKARHLLAAAYLAEQPDADAVSAVAARHLLDARDAMPGDPDAPELAERAVALLEQAAERAAELGSPSQAKRHYLAALAVAGDERTAARLSLGAAEAARTSDEIEEARALAERARESFERLGDPVAAAAALVVYAEATNNAGMGADLPDRLVPVYESIAGRADAGTVPARLAQQIGRGYFSGRGDAEAALPWSDRSVALAEALDDWRQVAECLGGYGAALIVSGRPTMGLGTLRVALDLAREHGYGRGQLVPLNNLASFLATRDVRAAAGYVDEGLVLARRIGEADVGRYLADTAAHVRWLVGDWDGIAALAADDQEHSARRLQQLFGLLVADARGEPVAAVGDSDELDSAQMSCAVLGARAVTELANGRTAPGLAIAAQALERYFTSVGVDDDFDVYWTLLLDAGFDSGDLAPVRRWLGALADLPVGRLSVLLRALFRYFQARLDAAEGGDPEVVHDGFTAAEQALEAFGAAYWLARARLDHAEWLTAAGRDAEASGLVAQAREAFVVLRAAPYLQRCARLGAAAVVGDTGIEPVTSTVSR